MPADQARHAHPGHSPAEPAGPEPREPGYPHHPEASPPSPHDGHGPAAGHDKHAGHSVRMFRDRFWVCFVLTLPVLAWGHLLPEYLGVGAPRFPGSHWIAPGLGVVVFAYGGLPFLQGAARELRDRLPGMMTLISLAIAVAFAYSVVVLAGFDGMPLWEELATLVTVMLLGHWMEMRSITRAHGALRELAKLLPSTATRLRDGVEEEVDVADLRPGDVVLVRPGGRVPADGVVRQGESAVDESMLTGESAPVDKRQGDPVKAGTILRGGVLRVEVMGTGDKTALAGIMRLVEQAQSSRSRAQALADRAAFFLTWVALAVAALTLAAWVALRAPAEFVVERVVTVLVIACPHALGLAIPLVVAISTSMGAAGGLLVRDRRGLEEARRVDSVVFDKTGTLTLGEHRVVASVSVGGVDEAVALRWAAALQHGSEHPIARAIVRSARDRGVQVAPAEAFEALPGKGVRARVEGRRLASGGGALLRELGTDVPEEARRFADAAAARGQGVTYLFDADARAVLAVFAVADAVRPESRAAVERLHGMGVQVVMMTGDSRAVADAVARDLGIDEVFAEVLPQEKAQKVKDLQARGRTVMMVGDGVNDAPALVTADVGVAIGAGTDVAVEAGDVVLVRSDPRDVARIVALSRASYRKMVQNLWWAAGYNIVAIPLAAGVLVGLGFVLHPAVGALLMSTSTLVVAVNAQLLRRVRL